MPEGPEVETVRRTLAPQLLGHSAQSAWVSQFSLRTKVTRAAFRPVLSHVVTEVNRHGKLLYVRTQNGAGVMFRLGMTGQVGVVPASKPRAKHTHVRLSLETGDELRFVDARRFGDVRPFASSAELEAALAKLGPDPLLLSAAGRQAIVDAIGHTARKVKDALLDQAVVAGVGNIYACEALYLAGVDPRRAGRSISKARREAIVDAVIRVLQDGVDNGGTTLRDYVDANGQRGDHQHHLGVFQREGEACVACQRPIVRETWGGRSTFFCRRCQR